MRTSLLVIAIFILTACRFGQQTQIERLPSGKEVKVIGMSKMVFSNGPPLLALKYQTDIPIDDVQKLGQESDEIWAYFKGNVETAGLSTGMISAHAPSKGFIVTTNKSFNFVYKKNQTGQWVRSPK